MRGALVVLEGIDQAGKMTQARALAAAAQAAGLEPAVRHYPDYDTPIGGLIRSFLAAGTALDAHARCMLFAANRWEKDRELRALCDAHALVCVDRYTASNVVYGMSQGVDETWLAGLETGLLAADLTVLVDIDPEESRRRKARERDGYERDARLLEAARTNYTRIARRDGWVVLDGARAGDAVTRDLVNAVRSRLGSRFPGLERLG
jgi:dTMP kinase